MCSTTPGPGCGSVLRPSLRELSGRNEVDDAGNCSGDKNGFWARSVSNDDLGADGLIFETVRAQMSWRRVVRGGPLVGLR